MSRAGGSFSGVLNGGNGHIPGEGQADYYEFQVGSGVADITANVRLTNDLGDVVGAYLVSPDGRALGESSSLFGFDPQPALSTYVVAPEPGTWTLALDLAWPTIGDEVSQPFTGDISFNTTQASAPTLPDSPDVLLAPG